VPITVELIDFISVPSQDLGRSREFYVETLGLPFERETPTGFEVKAGDVTLGVWDPTTADLPFVPTLNPPALRVADVHEARANLEAAGVTFSGETIDTGVCHMAFFHDPDGNAIMLHRRYAPL